MEVDQTFIAAILTIIGYSINDTVVVFDRIRETIGLYPKRDRLSGDQRCIELDFIPYLQYIINYIGSCIVYLHPGWCDDP